MGTWKDLDAELALWRGAGEVPTFWWRDDDTQAPTDDLDRLIAIAERHDAPLHLAVVPADMDAGLAERLRASPLVFTTQHGFAHKNHEAKGTGASEVGETREIALQVADLTEGWARMIAADLPNLLPVFVPPWNRIADKTLPHLVALGYCAVSTGGPRPDPFPVAGLQHINCQVDPIHWKQGARFTGTEKSIDQCLLHLRARRVGDVARDEPTGFCTHHLQTDAPTWDFMETFMDRVTHGGATRWLSLPEALDLG